MDTGDDVGALGELALAEGLGKGMQHPKGHGIGSHAEIVAAVRGQKPLHILGGHMGKIVPQSPQLGNLVPVHLGPAAAPGGREAQQDLPGALRQGNPDDLGNEPNDEPYRQADASQQEARPVSADDAEGSLMQLPGRHHGQRAEEQAQQNLQRRNGGHVHGHADAAEHLTGAEQIAIDVPLPFGGAADGIFAGNHGFRLAQGLGVGQAGGIHHPPVTKEAAEGPHLEEAALVAHIHALVQQHPSAVHLNENVTQLRPAEHHGGQIRPFQEQTAAQLTGGNALGGDGAVLPPGGEGPQEEQPVQKGCTCQNAHGYQLRIAGALVGADTGEHIRGQRHGHINGFMVVKAGFAAAGEHIAVVEQVQLRGKAVLLIGAVKIRGRGEFTGQGNGVVHGADGIGEAAEQRKLQLQIVLVHNLLAFVQRVGLHGHGDHLGKAVGNGDHIVPRLPAGDPGQADDGQGAGLVGGGGGTVDGDIGGGPGQGIAQILICILQVKVQRQADHGIAVHIDGCSIVQPGGRTDGIGPQRQKRKNQQ